MANSLPQRKYKVSLISLALPMHSGFTSTTGSSFIRRASATWWRDTCHDYDTMESSLMEQDYSSFVELSWVGKILWWTTKEYSIFIHSISFFPAVLYKYLRDKCMLHLCTWYFQKSIFKTWFFLPSSKFPKSCREI